MSDEPPQGPPMLCVTRVLKTPPTRIGKFGNVSLPTTVALSSVIAAGTGGFICMVIGFIISGGTVTGGAYGAVMGGCIGMFVTSYQPVQGESMLKYLGLSLASAARGTVMWQGKRVRMYIGIAAVSRAASGPTRIVAGAVPINPHNYDSRGVLITKRNMNTPEDEELARLDRRARKAREVALAEAEANAPKSGHPLPAHPGSRDLDSKKPRQVDTSGDRGPARIIRPPEPPTDLDP